VRSECTGINKLSGATDGGGTFDFLPACLLLPIQLFLLFRRAYSDFRFSIYELRFEKEPNHS
jgi:hypothetical protein